MLHRTLDQACATANYAKRVSNDFKTELNRVRNTLNESRALLLEKI